MNSEEIIKQLSTIVESNKNLSDDDKLALREACDKINNAKTKKDWITIVDILIKLLGIGANFFK